MSTAINLDDAYGKPLRQMNPEQVRMTFDGLTDEGAFHRAIAIARDLCRMGLWDGQSIIRIADPYKIFNALDCWVTIGLEDEYGELVVRWTEPLVRRSDEAQLPPSSLTVQAVDEIIADEWTEPATEEEIAYQSGGNSGDYLDDYDDDDHDDDYDYIVGQSVSSWVVKSKNGHISIGVGILTRFRGEDWGEASGWDESHYNLNSYSDAHKQRILKFMKDKAPGQYDLPRHFDEDEDDEDSEEDVCKNCGQAVKLVPDTPFCQSCYDELDDDDDDQDFDYTDKIYHGLDD